LFRNIRKIKSKVMQFLDFWNFRLW
jgi:hypothetical protein